MTRTLLIVAAVAIVGWFALKDWAFSFLVGEAATETEAPDYYYDDVWLERPETEPPGGWADPWGVDLFVIAPPVSSPVRKGSLPATDEALSDEYDSFVSSLGIDRQSASIYAPAFRSPSPASTGSRREAEIQRAQADMADAMKRYLSAENRMRGLVILAAPDSEPLLYAALRQLPEDQQFRERLGGVLVSQNKDESRWEDFLGSCSPAFEACITSTSMTSSPAGLAWLTPSLPRHKQAYSAGPDFAAEIDTRIETLSNWLDLNAEKPAEPFDSWKADEVVDVAPIRRPNGEEDISGDRGD